MLSSENPSDPSCPCKDSALRSDEGASDELSFQEADPEGLGVTQTPHFSIRGFVFKSRSENIATNWPFPEEFLRICLKHDVQDLLPPFEPTSLVRAQLSGKGVGPEQLIACSEAEQISTEFETLDIKDSSQLVAELSNIDHLPSDDVVVGCSNQSPHELLETKFEIDRKDTSDVELIDSEAEPQKISGTLKISCELVEKKCRLIVKLGTTSKTSQVEDIASTSNTVLDPMASKVCPVCKTFTSTSNTTLNAHIDQCLSVDSSSKLAVTKFLNMKAKPKKKRLMVDIYATTSHCTLEDLDRRNGTNWATDLAMLARPKEAHAEIKRPKLSPVDLMGGGEGDVYIDSNGTKLLILSKFDDTLPLMSRMHLKDIRTGRGSSIGRKRCPKPKRKKYMKVNPHSKKLSSLRSFKSENQVEPERECHASTHQEKSSSTHVSNAQDQVKSRQATLRQWVSSKRSILLKKTKDNDIHKMLEEKELSARKLIAENNKPELSDSSFVRSHTLRFTNSNELASLKTNGEHILPNVVLSLDSGKNKAPKQLENTSSASCVMLKLRSSGNFLSSSRSKREEISLSTTKESDNFSSAARPSEGCLSSVTAKNHSILKKKVSQGRPMNLKGNKVVGSKKHVTSKKLHKQRLVLRTGDQKLDSLSDESGELQSSDKNWSLGSGNANKISRIHQSNLSENATSPNLEENIDLLSIRRSNTEVSEQGREGSSATRRSKHTLRRLSVGVEHHSPVTGVQIEAAVCRNMGTELYKENAPSVPVLNESLILENSTPSMERHSKSTCRSQVPVRPAPLNLTGEQEMQAEDVTNDEISSRNTKMGGDMIYKAEDGSHKDQNRGCRVNSATIQESSTCLTCHDDKELEIPRGTSKIKTIKIVIPNKHNSFCIDREPSGSPGSVDSTISHPSPEDLEFNDLGEEPRPAATQDKLGPSLPKTIALPSSTSTRRAVGKMERHSQEAKQPEKFPHYEPCCCSRRESLSHEPLLLRQSFMAGMMLPLKGKQMSSTLCLKPSIFSSSDAYPFLRTDEVATPILESPTESIVTKASSYPVSANPFSQATAQATSNPILRLMGKNLVVNKELSSGEPPKIALSNLEKSMSTWCPTFGPSLTENASHCNGFSYYHDRLPGGSPLTGSAPSKGTSSWSALKNSKPNQHPHQKRMNKKPVSFASRSPYLARERMVINDSPQLKSEQKGSRASPSVILPPLRPGSDIMQQMSFPCLPSQNQFVLKEAPNVVRPFVSFAHPGVDANIINQGSILEGSVIHLGSPFTFLSNSAGSEGRTTPAM